VAEGARAAGREVVVVGRAMERVVQVARETGYLDGIQEFRGPDVYGYLPADKVVALCTGSQGEPRAALARIAQDDHPDITLARGDRVIFSSRTIPGNEKAVSAVINGLIDQGIEVITDRTHLVHVSGHPRIGEVEDLLRWVKPKILVPVHGEPLHLSEHAKIGRRLGIPTIVNCRNGDLVELAPGAPGVMDELPHGRDYKDGVVMVGADSRSIADRRRLSFVGLITVALALTERGVLAADPEVELFGIPERGKDGSLLAGVAMDAVEDTFESLPKPRRRDPDSVAEAIRRAVRSAVAQQWGKKPVCHVHILSV
jgi:ribonuclease J